MVGMDAVKPPKYFYSERVLLRGVPAAVLRNQAYQKLRHILRPTDGEMDNAAKSLKLQCAGFEEIAPFIITKKFYLCKYMKHYLLFKQLRFAPKPRFLIICVIRQ